MHILDLTLATNQLHEQELFYTQVLGLPLVERSPNKLILQVGSSQLSFVQSSEPMPGVYHFAFNIPENQYSQAKAWLQARTPLLQNADGEDVHLFESWNAHAMYFLDPAGNIAELIARHTLPNASEAPFSSSSLLSVSEIGIAADDVLTQVAHLGAHGGLHAYAAPASPTFTALGDEQGLFIVVPKGRIWYPETGRAAVHLPIQVQTGSADLQLSWAFPVV